jgi:acyl transferase domain-containing protein/NAD(P)H-dependent flavin oxidoreductase YrpB (nitropropane dioxygenase family)
MSGFEIFAVTPPSYLVQGRLRGIPDNAGQAADVRAFGAIALAAARAGQVGILDLQFADVADASFSDDVSDCLKQSGALAGQLGIKCGISQLKDVTTIVQSCLAASTTLQSYDRTEKTSASAAKPEQKLKRPPVILVPDAGERLESLALITLGDSLATVRELGVRVLVEVVSVNEAVLAESLGVDGIIAKGYEAAGYVGEQTTFVLLQECLKIVKVPVFADGGIGLHTASACFAAGAAGVVLTAQLFLTRESAIPFELQLKIEQMDGTEALVLPLGNEESLRVYARPNHPGLDELQAASGVQIRETLVSLASDVNPCNWIFPMGQEVAFASPLAQRFVSVAGIANAIKNAVYEHLSLAKGLKPLAPGSKLAASHGTEYPIIQGAMTRVSDTAQFALRVAQEGGLPFLALALMGKAEVEELLHQTSQKLAQLPWGVGILGFVPTQLRQDQLEVIQKYKPPFALIAGGRPDQAKFLEEQGIKTYLHVPSPLLLSSFIEMGSRRFIFEGRECGGHVGPRSSFVLWESMINCMLDSIGPREDGSAYHVLFAGGVHDALSACMVAAMAAKLAERGVRVGVLMGTAYLFTEEAVSSGAIVEKFQKAAIDCKQTVLLETGPGHSIRCIDSPYKRTFDEKRQALSAEGKGRDQIREELELMNLGRLRIASKGLTRGDSLTKDQIISEMSSTSPSADNARKLESVGEDKQWTEGMYMIGQVASMHSSITTIRQLHEHVSQGGADLLSSCSRQENSLDLPYIAEVPAGRTKQEPKQERIAVVGMSCLLPKAKNLENYWQNILNKVDTIEEIPADQWDWRNFYDENPLAKDKIYSKWGGFLENIEFDPTKYGIPPSSLKSIDPMQILLLEVTDAALKDAGYDNRPFPRDRTSVILANAGHGPITALYSLRSMLGWKLADLSSEDKAKLEARLPEWTEDSFPGYLGNVTAGRVANRYDLGGVNYCIDAACASSLAALHAAMAELRNGGSDVVLLAATDTHNQPGDYLSFSKTHAFSTSGRCKTFDASADGIVISEGMAMLVLKRLSDAERDGDRIYAVVAGIGGSSDGRDLSLTAPRPAGQVKALMRAYEDAKIEPATVTLIEAHGTGTVAGDKAEVEALKQVFERSGAQERSCAIGSVKTMIGHTKATAGLASLIKVAKALHHKVLPPTIGVKVPNPSCNFENGPFYINSETRPWILSHKITDGIRRAGVSAFGFGGTNFHAVLEEYVASPASLQTDALDFAMPAELFTVYGKSQVDLLKAANTLADSLKRLSQEERENPSTLTSLAYACYAKAIETQTQKAHRKTDIDNGSDPGAEMCLSIIASSISDLEDKLTRAKSDLLDANRTQIKDPRGIYFLPSKRPGKVAYLFPGQGSQKLNMLGDLTLQFPEMRGAFEGANRLLASYMNKPLSEFVYPPPSFASDEEERHTLRLTDTRIAQPAMGAADVAMLNLLDSFGVKPDMVAGHSYGEYVALFAAGRLSLADLFKISVERGQILSRVPEGMRGAMAAVSIAYADLEKMLAGRADITIANINGPNQCVIAGEESALEKVLSDLKDKGISAKRIFVSQAFHSPYMKHALVDLRQALSSLQLMGQQLPVYSNIDGMIHPDDAQELIERLTRHIVQPVDFVSEIRNMHADGADTFIEVGPSSVLTTLVDDILKGEEYLAVATDRSGRKGTLNLLHVLGQLAARGIKVDLRRLYSSRVSALPRSRSTLQDATASKKASASKAPKLTYLVNSAHIRRADQDISSKAVDKGKEHLATQLPGPEHSVALKSGAAVTSPVTRAPAAPGAQGAPASNNGGKSLSNKPKPVAASLDTGQSGKREASQVSAASSSVSPTPPPILPKNNTVTETNKAPVPNQEIRGSLKKPQLAPPSPVGDDVDRVMIEFQQTMLQMTNNFLETQQNVMLAYLQAQGNGSATSNPNLAPFNYAAARTAQSVWQTAPAQMIEAAADLGNVDLGNVATAGMTPEGQATGSGISVSQETPLPVATQETQQGPGGNGQNGQVVEVDPEFLVNSLLDIVSQRTGYPTEMLDPTLDMEADLGIDSIKRVEILNSFRRILPDEKQKQLEAGIEELAGTRTLQGIIDWLRAGSGKPVDNGAGVVDEEENNGNGKHSDPLSRMAISEVAKSGHKIGLETVVPVTGGSNGEGHAHVDGNGHNGFEGIVDTPFATQTLGANIRRGVVKLTPLPAVSAPETARADAGAQNKLVLITDDNDYRSAPVAKQFEERGFLPIILKHDRSVTEPDDVRPDGRYYRLDLTNAEMLARQLQKLQEGFGKVRTLVHLQSLATAQTIEQSQASDSVVALFLLTKLLSPSLSELSKLPGAGVVAATSMGGSFAIERPQGAWFGKAVQASIAGLVKSISKELPAVSCKVVDFSQSMLDVKPQTEFASKLIAELCARDQIVEVGYKGADRSGLAIENVELNHDTIVGAPLNADSVVLVTGGARGITAELALEIGEQYKPLIIIVGRSQRPEGLEDQRYFGLHTPRELKAAIMEQLKGEGKAVTIPVVEARYQALIRDREIRSNLATLESTGARVEYHAVDVRDAKAFSELIQSIYVEKGKINAVIHGAGVIEDAFMKDKTVESFRRVFETKVLGALTLVENLRLESLDYLVLFSSVVGRTGNAGQSDYAAANEVVNKLALYASDKVAGRAVSIMWGPWKGGMAQPELESIFASYGWAMIDVTAGRRAFRNELLCGAKHASEVLLVAELDRLTTIQPQGARLHQATLRRTPAGDYEFAVEVSTGSDLFLADHTFDGVPVMPMAFALEFMCEAVKCIYPDLQIVSIENLDIPSGIVFESGSKMLFVAVHEEERQGAKIRANAAVSSGVSQKRVNFRASFNLADQITESKTPQGIDPVLSLTDAVGAVGEAVSVPAVTEIYGQWLFHGPIFQGIKEIQAIGLKGVVGSICGRSPDLCLARPGDSKWQLDPILLDSAMQLGGIWARRFLDITALPTGFRRLTKFAEPVDGLLTVRIMMAPDSSVQELACDMAIYDHSGRLVMMVEALGGVGSKSLNRLSSGVGIGAAR